MCVCVYVYTYTYIQISTRCPLFSRLVNRTHLAQPSTSTHPAPLSAWKAVSKLRECGGG